MPTYQWKNNKTGEVKEIFCSIADRNIAPDGASVDSGDSDWIRILDAPNLMQVSLPDGRRRQNDPRYQNAKTLANLEVDRANAFSGSDERKKLDREIDKVRTLNK